MLIKYDRNDRRRVDEHRYWPHIASISSLVTSLDGARLCSRPSRQLRKPLTQRPLVALSLELTAQRVRDSLGHIGLAQIGELPRKLTDSDREC